MNRSMTLSTLSLGVLAICLYLSGVHAGFEHICSADSYTRRGDQQNDDAMCGRKLADFLITVLCPEGLAKRSGPTGIFQSQSQANSFLKPSKRSDGRTTGIVCECCINRCSLNEMYEYCLSDDYSMTTIGYGGFFKRSMMMERRGGNAADEEKVSEIYEHIQQDASGPSITIEELMKDPDVRQLERQKQLNLQHNPEDKRASAGEAADEKPSSHSRYSELKDYLKSKLSILFGEDSNSDSIGESRDSGTKSSWEKILKLIESD